LTLDEQLLQNLIEKRGGNQSDLKNSTIKNEPILKRLESIDIEDSSFVFFLQYKETRV